MSTATLEAAVGQEGAIDKKSKSRGRPQLSAERERINMSLSPKLLERLDALVQKTDASSYTEVFRNAIRLYDALIDEHDRGNEFLIRDPEGNLKTYKVFL